MDGTLNVLDEQFSPHGLTIDWEKKIILTSDFIVPLSILKPVSAAGKQSANTLRLWDLDTRTILNTITIPDGGGIQDVKLVRLGLHPPCHHPSFLTCGLLDSW